MLVCLFVCFVFNRLHPKGSSCTIYTIKAVIHKCSISNIIGCSLARCDVTQAFCERNLNNFTEQIEGQIATSFPAFINRCSASVSFWRAIICGPVCVRLIKPAIMNVCFKSEYKMMLGHGRGVWRVFVIMHRLNKWWNSVWGQKKHPIFSLRAMLTQQ